MKLSGFPDQTAYYLGVDIGSTTAKVVLIDGGEVLYECYERHFSQVRQKTLELVGRLTPYLDGRPIRIAISGSAGLGLARAASLPFVQEVFATGEAVKMLRPDTDAVIELGGEDAKVLFLTGGTEERMNGSCAGGTGAFIDQMATLMNVTNEEMDALSLRAERLYPIASRCGVFAKTDIQPLLNQGARKEDIAASIYKAVVNQTIAGLAQGRRIAGTIMFLGGPLYYCKGLRRSFVDTLGLDEAHAIFPEYGRYAVAIGAALYASRQNEAFTYDELIRALEHSTQEKSETVCLPPLFQSEEEYAAFSARHAAASVPEAELEDYAGKAYLGIDCGSTTTKLTLISEDCELLYSFYSSNKGNPIEIVLSQLKILREKCGDRVEIAGSAVTGYGEELIKHAFHVDHGLVETMAHFTAAQHFNPDVEFILDIGGQDIKCFKVRNNAIDSIMLNEACSSGCGSFIETFAKSMGYPIDLFSRLGLYAKAPVDLGSRCTVFMNSSVKQAQKDGASVEDISAGLSMSVVKNALYKVIRANSAEELGREIVVQGGTFYNDAVLRSFELEIGHNVVRPTIAGLMGAFGAALYARARTQDSSTLLTAAELENFTHTAKATTCRGCTNNCRLTINTFSGGEKYISGNKCERGAGKNASASPLPDLHEYKRKKFEDIFEAPGRLGTIGLPLALGMYELAPFWRAIFAELGFGVVLSGFSSRELYAKGQYSIPSDTACYPAKIMHGHIETLLEKGVDAIFYPCLTYNFDEGISDNHYNCPVVAYYAELLNSNMDSLQNTKFMYPYLNINNAHELAHGLGRCLRETLGITFRMGELSRAVSAGFAAYEKWMQDVRREGAHALSYARANGRRVMILAGRPYHIDPEIGHGINKLATALGFVVVSEDAIGLSAEPPKVDVLNQWTYHARLYNAAQYAAMHPDVELVQLVSFGCGVDAITADEVRAILERGGRLYTQIKIDEITNLGAVTIRLRSLLGAIEAEKEVRV
jgi:predicted CoA-substrate-specific enzyme activase